MIHLLEDQTHTVIQDQINNILVIHYYCRERLNVRRFNLNRLDECSTNPHDVAYSKPRVDLFIRAKATTVLAYQCSLSYTKTTKIMSTILRLTNDMIDKVTIRAHWLGIMLLLRLAVRVMSAFSWNIRSTI